MMFTPRNQLENMLSCAAGQIICGNNVADNSARVIALQAQIQMQQQHESNHLGPRNMFTDWDDWD
jgi:hypothetical protein